MAATILVVDDDRRLLRLLDRRLRDDGDRIDACVCAQNALQRGLNRAYAAILVDWQLPDHPGLKVVRDLRSAGVAAPILMISGRVAVADRIRGLEAGADDYVCKPFDLEELVTRIRAHIRRHQGLTLLHCGALTLDCVQPVVEVGGQTIALSPREHALLLYFARHQGRPIGRSELLWQVWGIAIDPGTCVIDVQISRLRSKLGPAGAQIATIRGFGYVMHGTAPDPGEEPSAT